MTDVFKLQRPLFHSGEGLPMMLVYNKTRSVEFTMSYNAAWWLKNYGTAKKVYVSAEWNGTEFNIIRKLEGRKW